MPTTLEYTIPRHSTHNQNISRLFGRQTFIVCPSHTYLQKDPLLVRKITRLYENGYALNPECPSCGGRVTVPENCLEYQYNP
ncbi:MAG TPA: hypothetical protein VN174_04410 [Candidatus Methanoperedens sp.]|nr:hypothetical protein [Candidatus Methanoperedens sp.]